MKTILYNPIFINPLAYYVFPRLTRWLRPDNGYKEPANYIGLIEVTIIAYGEIGYTEYFEHTNYIDFTNFSNSYVRISLFTRLGSCVLGEWKIGNMESDLPYIDPEVLASLKAVVIVGNKTNNDSDRAIIKNLVDPDNPFIISNAAFKLNSGFGKYEEDFTDWRIYPNIKVTDSVVTTDGNFKSSWFIYKHSSESKINEMNIKVSGIPKGGKILYFYISDETANMPIAYTIPKDGIYHLPESKINNNRASVGFTVESSYDWNNIRIEQIPSFEGAYCLDGVDDFVTIPTLSSGGKQVLMKVNWHGVDDEVLYDQRNSNIQGNYDLAISTYPDTIAYNFRNEGGKTFIDGILNSHIITNNLKNITHNISSINGYNNDNNSTICIGKSVFNGAFAQMALYDFMLFDSISTDDKIKELNEYVGIEGNTEWRKTK